MAEESEINHNEYKKYIFTSWDKFKTLPVLNADEILDNDFINDEKQFMLVFYGYLHELKTKFDYLSNKKTKFGDNLYLLAAYYGHIDIMKYLKNEGFDVHIKNNYGCDAYLSAACNGHIETMKYLKNEGFDVHIKNNNGCDAYLLAARNKHVLEYLMQLNIEMVIGGSLDALKFLEKHYDDDINKIYEELTNHKLNDEIIDSNNVLNLKYYKKKCKILEQEIEKFKLRPGGEQYMKLDKEFYK